MPVHQAVRHRVVCDAHRVAALGRNHVDVDVAVVVRAERDPGAVRREARELLLATWRTQAYCHAALLGHHPDVARIDKRDLRRRHVRLPEHARVDLRPGVGCGHAQKSGNGDDRARGSYEHVNSRCGSHSMSGLFDYCPDVQTPLVPAFVPLFVPGCANFLASNSVYPTCERRRDSLALKPASLGYRRLHRRWPCSVIASPRLRPKIPPSPRQCAPPVSPSRPWSTASSTTRRGPGRRCRQGRGCPTTPCTATRSRNRLRSGSATTPMPCTLPSAATTRTPAASRRRSRAATTSGATTGSA